MSAPSLSFRAKPRNLSSSARPLARLAPTQNPRLKPWANTPCGHVGRQLGSCVPTTTRRGEEISRQARNDRCVATPPTPSSRSTRRDLFGLSSCVVPSPRASRPKLVGAIPPWLPSWGSRCSIPRGTPSTRGISPLLQHWVLAPHQRALLQRTVEILRFAQNDKGGSAQNPEGRSDYCLRNADCSGGPG
jgi:hypothetical protein